MPVTEPENLWAVLDQDSTVYAAAHPRACHEHINDAIDNDVQDAGKMVVREYVSLKAHNEELARLRAENERLRGALDNILARTHDGSSYRMAQDIYQTAIDALVPTAPPAR